MTTTLKDRIESSALSQNELARMLGVDPGNFSKYLAGKKPMPGYIEQNAWVKIHLWERAEEARAKVLREG